MHKDKYQDFVAVQGTKNSFKAVNINVFRKKLIFAHVIGVNYTTI